MNEFISATYHPDILTVEYVASNGDHLLRSGGTIAWRFNNPGNLRPGSKYTLHIGKGITKSGPFLIFPTVDAGRTEKKGLLLRKYKDSSVTQMMALYAPPSENDTDKYVNYITTKSGVNEESKIGELSEAELSALMQAMEQYEGFNAKAETRKETWVRTTKITLSDGARPIAGQEVTLKKGKSVTILKTNSYGQLPSIPHPSTDEPMEIWIKNAINKLEKVDSFTLSRVSQAFIYFTDFFSAQAATRSHLPASAREKKKPAPFSYVVQPGDTISKIAKKFKTNVDKIASDNKLKHPDKIFPGQRLSINGLSLTSNSQASTTPRENTGKAVNVATTPARSKEGQGHPIAVIPSDQKRAPWMEIALSEAKKWGGESESEIDDTINYHEEIGANFLKSMSGSSNAWCASFVNWSLEKSGYPKWKTPYRARAVATDKNFVQIEKPIYGAIGLIGTHHVCLVYGRDKNSKKVVCLGGNQSDQISFTTFKEATKFFVPVTYLPYAKDEETSAPELNLYDVKELNQVFGITLQKKTGDTTR